MKHVPVIAIDGPSGAGKGTVCQWLAQHLGWHLLDSGALYRIVAYAAAQAGVDLQDADALITCLDDLSIDFDHHGHQGVRVLLDGREVTKALRSETCASAASQVAALAPLRQALLERQRCFRQSPGLVADGRDMGTVVFPDADLKVFLTASASERAKRRYKQLNDKGISANLADLFEEIQARDERDMRRAAAPLKPASDAYTVDTTGVSIETVCQTVLELVKKRGLQN